MQQYYLIIKTLRRASELSDAWVGTTTGSIIDSQAKHLEYLVSEKEDNLASIQVLELTATLDEAERALNE